MKKSLFLLPVQHKVGSVVQAAVSWSTDVSEAVAKKNSLDMFMCDTFLHLAA